MNDELIEKLEDILEESRIKREQLLIEYPPDIPNESSHHAFIKGISLENSFCPSVGEYNFLFETECEKIYVWSHTKDKSSALISKIDISVKEKEFWKTVGSMINLSLAYYHAFESVDFDSKLEYKFMYYFSPTDTFDDVVFSNVSSLDSFCLFDSQILKATDLAELAPVIELLNRDDGCFTALSLLFSSIQIHYCCLTCELGLLPNKKHESHEPELWAQADSITNMESAIVQACRCAESILKAPPNQHKNNRILLHKKKWIESVGVNPDEPFARSGMSYWEFYLKLFDKLRNPSAHSYGNIHFDLERKHTIDAQCFAALILRGYINKNILQSEEAMDILKFDRIFLSRVQLNVSTMLTRDA